MHFFPTLSGFYCILNFFKGTQIIGLLLESDLCYPSSGSLILIHTGVSACVGTDGPVFYGFQHLHRCSVNPFHILPDDLPLDASAAFCPAQYQVVLPDHSFIPAVTAAAPIILSVDIAFIGKRHQLTKPHSYEVFYRRTGKTAAAFGSSVLEQGLPYAGFLAAAHRQRQRCIPALFPS